MQTVHGSQQVSATLHGAVVTMGNFDGVHLGHQTIIADVCAAAKRDQAPSLVYTLYPHPAKVLAPALGLQLIQTLPQRLRSLAATGIDATIVEDFSPAFAALSAQDFFAQIIVGALAPRRLILGYDLTFGHQRQGRAEDLQVWATAANIACDIVQPQLVGEVLVSSTYIRRCIVQGHIEAATEALGRPFALEGELVRGRGVGRQLGFPTLNLVPHNELMPPEGVYITSACWDTESNTDYPAATYIGRNPTFGGDALVVETYMLADEPPETLAHLEVRLHRRIRGDMTFRSAEALKNQIADDVNEARAFHGLAKD
jgi:riboflavin kinase / FMN adenylyltransferase